MDRNTPIELPAGLLLDVCQGIVTLTERRRRYFRKPPVGRKKSELMELKEMEEKLQKQAETINKRLYNLLEGPSNG